MDVLRRIRRQDRCAHKATITVQNLGIERVVCEACGHVSVHFLSDLAGEVDRDRFARPLEREGKHARGEDEAADEALVEVFLDAPRSGSVLRNPHASPWREPEADLD